MMVPRGEWPFCLCGGVRRNPSQRYCLSCHAAAMRAWRKANPLTRAQRTKMNARSYANVYQRRGHLVPKPCEVFGCERKAQKHHRDYRKPLEVRWLCRVHHLRLHRRVARAA